jgi:hypothetical protein
MRGDLGQHSRGRGLSTKTRAAIRVVGVSGGIEDLRRHCVDAASLSRGACRDATVNVVGDTKKELFHGGNDISDARLLS